MDWREVPVRKRIVLALLLVLALLATTSCSLIVKDEEVDKQTPIIEVGATTITKEMVNQQMEEVHGYMEYMYYLYGMSYDRTSESAIATARDQAVQLLTENAVMEQKIQELGLDQLTAEEEAQVQADADETWQTYYDSTKTFYFSDTELEGEELEAAILEEMTALGYPTKESIQESARTTLEQEKLRSEAIKDVVVTQQELEDAYNANVESARSSYETSLSAYGTDVNNGSTIYYVPAGYRFVKNILIKLNDDDSTAISELNSQLTSKQSELATAQSSLSALGDDASADDEETALNRETLTATEKQLTGDITALTKQLNEKTEEAYAAIQPVVDEVLAKLAAGEDFDALMEEYGQDTGMQSSPAKENGYPVCAESTNWVQEFTDAAMALAQVGDTSAEGVRTSYGIHILKYVSDSVEGEVGLDAVRDTLEADLLSEKQDETYSATLDQWIADANVKTYLDKLD